MSMQTTILTRHDVTIGDMTASMMLDDAGNGHAMVSSSTGPAFSMDVSRLAETIAVLTECRQARELVVRGSRTHDEDYAFLED